MIGGKCFLSLALLFMLNPPALPLDVRLQAPTSDFKLAILRYAGGMWDPRPNGLSRLAWELRRRTSVEISLDVAAIDATSPELFAYPLVVWQGERAFVPLANDAVAHLRQHITRGGTLLVDVSDARENGEPSAFYDSAVRDLRRVFPDRPLVRVSPDHVLYKSFYLLSTHGGRVPARAYLEGIFVQNRLAVVIFGNDLAGAMARDVFGEWDYDVGAGGAATREASYRLAINVVMYALCLDYKEDQVHIPFILQRRR